MSHRKEHKKCSEPHQPQYLLFCDSCGFKRNLSFPFSCLSPISLFYSENCPIVSSICYFLLIKKYIRLAFLGLLNGPSSSGSFCWLSWSTSVIHLFQYLTYQSTFTMQIRVKDYQRQRETENLVLSPFLLPFFSDLLVFLQVQSFRVC